MSNKGTANQNKRPTFEMKKKKKFISGWKLSLFALLCLFVFYALHPFIFGTPQDEYGYENDEPEIAYEEEIIEQEQIPIKEQVEEPLTQISASEQVITKEDDIAYLIGALNAEYENEAEEENKENSTDSIHDEHSYKLYEEELPDNIIDEEQTDESSSTVHYQQKNIKDMDVKVLPRPEHNEKKLIAVVIDDMGVNVKRTKDIISLQAPLTSSFLTYGPHLSKQIEQARAAGHEIMAHVPMQPYKDLYTAPDGLTVNMSDEELSQKFEIMLQKFSGIRGVNNHMGSKFTEDKRAMGDIMKILKAHDLFFLDSKTTAKSVGGEVAKKYGVKYATRHVFLDNNNEKKYILGQLKQAEKIANKNGYAVAIGHPKSQTYAALKEWLPTLEAKGLKLVHMSEIVELRNKE